MGNPVLPTNLNAHPSARDHISLDFLTSTSAHGDLPLLRPMRAYIQLLTPGSCIARPDIRQRLFESQPNTIGILNSGHACDDFDRCRSKIISQLRCHNDARAARNPHLQCNARRDVGAVAVDRCDAVPPRALHKTPVTLIGSYRIGRNRDLDFEVANAHVLDLCISRQHGGAGKVAKKLTPRLKWIPLISWVLTSAAGNMVIAIVPITQLATANHHSQSSRDILPMI